MARVIAQFTAEQVERWHELTGPVYPQAGSLRWSPPRPTGKSTDKPTDKPNGEPAADSKTRSAEAAPPAAESKPAAKEL
jgi:hypothetical protein